MLYFHQQLKVFANLLSTLGETLHQQMRSLHLANFIIHSSVQHFPWQHPAEGRTRGDLRRLKEEVTAMRVNRRCYLFIHASLLLPFPTTTTTVAAIATNTTTTTTTTCPQFLFLPFVFLHYTFWCTILLTAFFDLL